MNMDPSMKTQQRIMNTVMPLFMFYITSTIPGGVGIYWITSNVFQICQQILINKYYENKMSDGSNDSKEKDKKDKSKESKRKVASK